MTRRRLIVLTATTAVIACLISFVAWIGLFASSIGSSCPQADDPTCHSHNGALDIIGPGLLLAAIGVGLLSVAVAVSWGQPAPAFRWQALVALAMAPMPTTAVIVFLLLYLPTSGLLATIVSASLAVAWLVAWARFVRWASCRLPAEPAP
jgi:hypothetical protein